MSAMNCRRPCVLLILFFVLPSFLPEFDHAMADDAAKESKLLADLAEVDGKAVRDLRLLGAPVVAVNFGVRYRNGPEVTAAVIGQLKQFKHLSQIGFYNIRVGDDTIEMLRELPNLTEIALYGPQITDETVNRLGRLNRLSHLRLYNVRVTDSGISDVAKLSTLSQLVFADLDKFLDTHYKLAHVVHINDAPIPIPEGGFEDCTGSA